MNNMGAGALSAAGMFRRTNLHRVGLPSTQIRNVNTWPDIPRRPTFTAMAGGLGMISNPTTGASTLIILLNTAASPAVLDQATSFTYRAAIASVSGSTTSSSASRHLTIRMLAIGFGILIRSSFTTTRTIPEVRPALGAHQQEPNRTGPRQGGIEAPQSAKGSHAGRVLHLATPPERALPHAGLGSGVLRFAMQRDHGSAVERF